MGPDIETMLRAALSAHKAERFEEAEDGYQAVLRSSPGNPKAHYYLGLLRFHSGDTSAAIQAMRQCLRTAPNHPHAWNSLGAMLIAAGSPAEAKHAYQRVTETAPGMGEGWYNLGICLRDEGDLEGAIASLRTSVAREPGYSRSYEALGMLLYQLGRMPEAAELYREWVAHDSTNPVARHMLAATSQQDMPVRAPDDYVRKLFDDSAKTFDADLAKLGYRAPQIVAEALAECAAGQKFEHVLDAGCGTGLCGPLIRNHCASLQGVDISPGMIAQARARGCYDELTASELCTFLQANPNRFDAIVSADTFVYFGDLEALLAAARAALRAGGVLIYTVEALPDDASCDYALEVHGRFAHRELYIRHLMERHGLSSQVARHVLRKERDKDVAGLLVAARGRQPRSAGSDSLPVRNDSREANE